MIPERNGISRLDEMVSGAVMVDMLIEWLVYYIHITVYVLQIVGVTSWSLRMELTAWLRCVVFYSQLSPRVARARLMQAVVYLEYHVVLFKCFYVIVHSW